MPLVPTEGVALSYRFADNILKTSMVGLTTGKRAPKTWFISDFFPIFQNLVSGKRLTDLTTEAIEDVKDKLWAGKRDSNNRPIFEVQALGTKDW
jgi:hypothetical protein